MKKKKEKFKENKVWKWFRHLASLGVGGAIIFLFPNFIITQLSFFIGILVGKGVISATLGFTITTFLGSQAGLWLQKGIIALLSYLISNITLKFSGKLFQKLKGKNKQYDNINKHKLNYIESKETELTNTKEIKPQFEEPFEYEFINEEPIISNQQEKKYVKKIGTHPSYKK